VASDTPQNTEHPLDSGLARVRHLRSEGARDEAVALLTELETQYPASGLLWQERALGLRTRGDTAGATAAFERAVQLNDALPDSWLAVFELHRSAGRSKEAARAAACIAKLRSLPPELLRGSCLLNEGRLEEAEEHIRGYLRRHGPHIEGMRLLAQANIKREVLDDAELLLEEVLRSAPHYHDARYELGMVLARRRRYLPALMHARDLLRIDRANAAWQRLYATACDGLGGFDEALRVYQQLLVADPSDAGLRLETAHALMNSGDTRGAIEQFKVAASMPGGAGGAFLALANMKSYRFSEEEIQHLRCAESEAARAGAARERYQLCFALGKALEERREFEESFRFYAYGNALKRSELVYRPEVEERSLRLQATTCTAEFLAERAGTGCPHPDPIFIVGLPRSGSTLIEQILASHSKVDGTMELPEIPRLIQQFRSRRATGQPRYPAVLGELEPQELRRLGEIYLEETGVYRRGAPFFVDKMLRNFHDVGFIHLILPNARIIDARRGAMACCFGSFKQLFVNGHPATYDLAQMGRYYRSYVAMMAHWDYALPGKILRVQHEDLVHDLEGSVRRILDFCGLDFEPACVEFHKTQRVVRTLSADQVRRPIYREGLDHWRNYEPWLGPLREALGALATRQG
jgi:tetratricopeptide (TPR) repeat protein